jgi:hypothetical protein
MIARVLPGMSACTGGAALAPDLGIERRPQLAWS